jgi:alpha-D-ribose 1-methylphosphonate 5-triphosphate synthase subunit PhnH
LSIPREAAKMTLRCQLNRCCGPLNEATTAQILGLLDFQGPAELAAWMAGNA